MFVITVECGECDGTWETWSGSQCMQCDEGQKVYRERYETMADAREDYPHAVSIEEDGEAVSPDLEVVEGGSAVRQSELKPYAWGTVERQMLELIDLQQMPDTHFGPAAGVSHATISNYRLRRRRPDLSVLYRVADHLGYKVRLVRDEY